jgi:heme A synthase
MYVAVVVLLALFVTVVRQRRRLGEGSGAELPELAWVTIVVLIAQVLLGALNVWAGEHAWMIVAHLALGTLLWLSLVRFAFALTSVPEASAAAARRRAPTEAATA